MEKPNVASSGNAAAKTDATDPDVVVEPTTRMRLLPLLTKIGKLSGVGLAIWLVGYTKFSFLWVVIGLFLYISGEEYKKLKRNQRLYTQQAVRNEREAVTARLQDLPSWVYFPDIERAEWLNKMVQQFWPFVGEYVKTLLTNTVGPQVEKSLPERLRPFKFTEIDLGDLPPRIGGVKVYTENVKRDEIIMDMEILYASDSNFKVSLRGMSAGIKDFSMRAELRVIFNPLCNTMPLFGGLTYFFLRTPEIDFDLTDMANALDFPLFGNTIRSVIEDQISAMLVLPNRKVIPILNDADMKKLAYPLPQGVIRIHAVGARELEKKDIGLLGKGKSDPFCEIEAGSQIFKTSVIESTVEPSWNEYFEAVIEQTHGQTVEIHCFDKDPTGENDNLGTTSIEISEIMSQGFVDSWASLKTVKSGMLHMRYRWLHLSSKAADLDKASKDAKKDEDQLSTAILLVMLDSAKNLARSKKSGREPSPRVKLSVGSISKLSLARTRTVDPRFEQNFLFMLLDPRIQNLDVEVQDSAKDDKKIGALSIPLKSLLESPGLTLERRYALDTDATAASGTEPSIAIRLCLRILTSDKPKEDVASESSAAQNRKSIVVPPTPSTVTPATLASVPGTGSNPVPALPTSPPSSTSVSVVASTTPIPAAATPTTPATPATPAPQQPTPVDTSATKSSSSSSLAPAAKPAVNVAVSNGSKTPSAAAASGEPHATITPDVVLRTPSSVVTPTSKYGSINLTVRYSTQRSRLICVVHKCAKLIPCDSANLADPYVRLYLLPERSNSSKRKTDVQKDTLNPVFDETFEWAMTTQEFATKSIEVGVKNSVSMLSKQRENMGKVVIKLSNYDITKPVTEWFELEDPGND